MSHEQSLCVVFVFGQENVATGLKIVLAVFLWCVEAPYGGELRLHHCRIGLSDFCGKTSIAPLSLTIHLFLPVELKSLYLCRHPDHVH